MYMCFLVILIGIYISICICQEKSRKNPSLEFVQVPFSNFNFLHKNTKLGFENFLLSLVKA